MDTQRRFHFSVAYRLILIAVCLTGLYLNLEDGGRLDAHSLIYYTIQSNLWVLGVTVLLLVRSFYSRINSKKHMGKGLRILRYSVTAGITLTFLVFWGLLSSIVETEYLFSLNNLCVHTLVPVLYVLDFFLFDREAAISRKQVVWSAAMPLYYLVFSLVRAELIKDTLYTGSRYPYFFMDLDQYGWFGTGTGMGVFWWMLVLLLLVISIGTGYRAIYNALLKRQAKIPPV